jgi:hypothetical protein
MGSAPRKCAETTVEGAKASDRDASNTTVGDGGSGTSRTTNRDGVDVAS